MKKVGFIDYYLDEWHANNYPQWIKKHSEGRYEVAFAYAKIDKANGLTNKEWADKFNAELLSSIEEVTEKSDVLVVLSPDNPEMHQELTDLPLKSGKPVYIDKTFAPDKKTAIKIFENAELHNTPCYSSSALRFASELKDIEKSEIFKIYSRGPGVFEIYSIHQIEPVISLMECDAKRVMALSDEAHPSFVIEFEDGRLAQFHHSAHKTEGFEMDIVKADNSAERISVKPGYFDEFTKSLIQFFDTGIIPVPHSQTICVIALIEAARKALKSPFCWITV